MKIGRLLLRTTVGGFFVGHGTQKLFGLFDGEGLNATANAFDSMGIRPGKVQAIAGGVAETAGGAATVLGYRTPLASSALVGSMLVAITKVHGKNGPWAQKGGFEYNAVLAAAAVALAEVGPGPISLDALRGKERIGTKWALLALALGTAGAAASHLLSEAKATPSEGPVEPIAQPVPTPATPAPASGSEAPTEVTETVIVVEEVVTGESNGTTDGAAAAE
jgi:putative oxidoreductase